MNPDRHVEKTATFTQLKILVSAFTRKEHTDSLTVTQAQLALCYNPTHTLTVSDKVSRGKGAGGGGMLDKGSSVRREGSTLYQTVLNVLYLPLPWILPPSHTLPSSLTVKVHVGHSSQRWWLQCTSYA